jgi:phosphatidylglycerol:prolipoprotein diacylglycerol transferase
MHPYQLMDYLLLYCGLFGFAGAILFAKLEDGSASIFSFNGLNYYGALIAGVLTFLYINKRYGIRPAVALDIGSPGMMLAYAIGRIGCHIAGDGDWGIVNEQPRPAWLPEWLWASRYPHNSVHQGIYIPGCTGSHCTILPTPVYPTPLYEAIICFCLFLLLWMLRRQIKKAGLLFAYFAMLNGAERFAIEFIRINPRYHIGYWNLSQAQVIALGWLLTGFTILLLSTRKSGLQK